MPELNTDLTKVARDVAGIAKDATYVAIGIGVIGYQKAQVQRHELAKRIGSPRATAEQRLAGVRTDLAGAVHAVDARVEDVFTRVEAVLVPLEDKLPTQAREVARQVRSQATEVRQQIRSAILSAAA
ncbi:MAG: hypothetical protein M0Z62_08270 [Actinomycetota bacterium]|nr:hypothetical protein [Actinomycetota bacterium]